VKVGIIGSGIAGIMAGSDLYHQGHEITIYESKAQIGGHARTVWVDGMPHELGVFMFDPKAIHPMIAAYARTLNVEMRTFPLTFTVEYASEDISWTTALNTVPTTMRNLIIFLSMSIKSLGTGHFLRNNKFLLDLRRFNSSLEKMCASCSEYDQVNLGEFIQAQRISQNIVDFWLKPNLICWWGVNSADALSCSARVVLDSFLKVFCNHQYIFVNGWNNFIETVAKPFKNRIITECPVDGVTRKSGKVQILSKGRQMEYDHVIFATPPSKAVRILSDPDKEEKDILQSFTTTTTEVFLHKDNSWLPQKNKKALINSIKDHRGEFCTFWTGSLHRTKPNVYVTWGDQMKEAPNERDIITSEKWLRTLPTMPYICACHKINEIQGRRGIWHAGAHVHALDPKDSPSVWHENAFLSGRAVASKINNFGACSKTSSR